MSVLLTCPKCQRKLKVGDNVLGKNLKCPGCAAVFPAKAPAGAATLSASPKGTAPSPDDEDEAPRRPVKAAREDDDDDYGRPAKKSASKKGRASGGESGRPANKAKKKSSAGMVLALAGVLVLLLLGGGGVFAYIYYKGAKPAGGAIADAQSKMTAKGPVGSPVGGPDKGPVGEPLAGPRPAAFPEKWKEFKSDEAGFRVMLPGTPNPFVSKDHHGNPEYRFIVPMTEPGAVNRVIWDEYLIHVRDYPEARNPPVLGAEAVLQDIPKYAGPVNWGLGKEPEPFNVKAGTFAGKPGRAWDVKDANGGTWHVRACLVGTRAYRLVAGPETTIPAADADMFFSSFELLAK